MTARSTLQWGRGQTAAERHRAHVGRLPVPASMGPRPNGRGKINTDAADVLGGTASMGPRPNGRGKEVHHWTPPDMVACFNGAAAKRPRKGAGPQRRPARHPRASMGPRPNGRGKHVSRGTLSYASFASMGPRPNGRGKA